MIYLVFAEDRYSKVLGTAEVLLGAGLRRPAEAGAVGALLCGDDEPSVGVQHGGPPKPRDPRARPLRPQRLDQELLRHLGLLRERGNVLDRGRGLRHTQHMRLMCISICLRADIRACSRTGSTYVRHMCTSNISGRTQVRMYNILCVCWRVWCGGVGGIKSVVGVQPV